MKNGSTALAVALCLLGVGVVGCGGSGSDDGDSGSGGGEVKIEACSAIGLAKIYGGHACNTSAGDTSLVRLTILNDNGEYSLCSGTVIGDREILTAAHCVGSSTTGVFASRVLVQTQTVSLEADRVSIDPSFYETNDAFFNDVAIIRVPQVITDPRSALLTSRPVSVGEELVVAGFGLQDDGATSGELLAGNAFVESVTSQHILTRSPSNPCYGDSGSAAFALAPDGTQAIAGVVSTGNPNAPDCGPEDYTRYAAANNADVLAFIVGEVPEAVLK